ncbi:MAG TPA: radical SAM protein [Propylenella sp.]|nr:radical SAM protein [Propylenella sp.]
MTRLQKPDSGPWQFSQGPTDPDVVLSGGNLNETAAGICFEFPNRAKIDVLLTYQCNAACAHCITESDPYRTEWLDEVDIRALLEAGREFGKTYVAFTGGEPTLRMPRLLDLIGYSKSLGYFVACDTNAHWGGSAAKAERNVVALVGAGLDALFPSADPYHLPYIPLASVENVIQAADRAGLVCEVNFCPGPDAQANLAILTRLNLLERGFFSDGLSLTGRDVEGLKPCFPGRRADQIDDVGSMHFGVSPRGDCYANVDISYTCAEFAGTPLALGSLRTDGPTAVLANEASDPIIDVLQTVSPAVAHRILSTCRDLSSEYLRGFAQRQFYSATEFWLAIFKEPLWPRVRERLLAWPGGGT